MLLYQSNNESGPKSATDRGYEINKGGAMFKNWIRNKILAFLNNRLEKKLEIYTVQVKEEPDINRIADRLYEMQKLQARGAGIK